ncbi:MAG: hypothetical protein Q4C63_07190 [Eubacteriales bacterium]|nr:hypothetical protein [Eubacteriales bacterium]
MNYAVISSNPFTTTKNLINKKMSEETKKRRAFIRAHKFAVYVDPISGEGKVVVTKKND